MQHIMQDHRRTILQCHMQRRNSKCRIVQGGVTCNVKSEKQKFCYLQATCIVKKQQMQNFASCEPNAIRKQHKNYTAR